MKGLSSLFLLVGGLALLGSTSTVFGQTTEGDNAAPVRVAAGVRRVLVSPERMREILRQAAAGATVPMWNYSVVSPIDGNTYTGAMIGRDPSFNAHGHSTTTVDFYLAPLILKFPSGGPTFDPTAANACDKDNNGTAQSALFFLENSPEFVGSSISINGIGEGAVQYTDAFERGNFDGVPPGVSLSTLPYHLQLNLIVAPAQTLNVPASWHPATVSDTCGTLGYVDETSFDAYLQGTAIPAVTGAGPDSLIFFLTDSVYTHDPSGDAAGYHSAFFPNGVLQVYGFAMWRSSAGTPNSNGHPFQAGDADVDAWSHEIAEATDDPTTGNPAPAWGNIGQVTGCQADVEVGDPLTGTDFSGITLSNFTYHPQELVFFSWFMRQSPSLGAGGKFSDNGSFTTDAGAVCQ